MDLYVVALQKLLDHAIDHRAGFLLRLLGIELQVTIDASQALGRELELLPDGLELALQRIKFGDTVIASRVCRMLNWGQVACRFGCSDDFLLGGRIERGYAAARRVILNALQPQLPQGGDLVVGLDLEAAEGEWMIHPTQVQAYEQADAELRRVD
nr:hypothetical protein [Pseudomarimonas arenosa]